MPELPEVTVIVNSLNSKLKGLVLDSVEYDWPKKFYWAAGLERPLARRGNKWVLDLTGMVVAGVSRRGKIIIIEVRESERVRELESIGKKVSSQLSILIHLKLTGQLIYQDAKTRIAGGHPIPPLNLPVPNKTTRASFEFTNPSTHSDISGQAGSGQVAGHLYFNDMRKFGWVKIVESEKLKAESLLEKLGPDALEISLRDFIERIKKKPNARIKKLLMDQSFISGVGNIYSDEALWLAKIHPKRPVVSLSDSDLKAVLEGIRSALRLSIEKGGSSANSFVGSGGEKGLYLSFANAYHMTGKPCVRCKTPIVREKMDGRSAHYCPSCQKLK